MLCFMITSLHNSLNTSKQLGKKALNQHSTKNSDNKPFHSLFRVSIPSPITVNQNADKGLSKYFISPFTPFPLTSTPPLALKDRANSELVARRLAKCFFIIQEAVKVHLIFFSTCSTEKTL